MTERPSTLILGIGNLLMGDEGVGPEVVRSIECEVERRPLPAGVTCLDGGTGSFGLLGPMQEVDRVVMVDACNDGKPPGSVTVLRPRFSSDYPATLTAHDIGLKDILDALYIMGSPPAVTLYAVSIDFPQPMRLGLGSTVAGCVSQLAERVLADATAGVMS